MFRKEVIITMALLMLLNAVVISMFVVELQNHKKPVPGWNTHLSTKHLLARKYLLEWICSGKPSVGISFSLMKTSRTQFKLALKYIQNNERNIVANIIGEIIVSTNQKSFRRK